MFQNSKGAAITARTKTKWEIIVLLHIQTENVPRVATSLQPHHPHGDMGEDLVSRRQWFCVVCYGLAWCEKSIRLKIDMQDIA